MLFDKKMDKMSKTVISLTKYMLILVFSHSTYLFLFLWHMHYNLMAVVLVYILL